jgi:hypothetical protein
MIQVVSTSGLIQSVYSAKMGCTVICKLLPGAINSRYLCLATQYALSSDLSSNARHLAGENLELVHHSIDNLEKS